MSSSSGKKIVRKVFYATGSAVAQVDKLKDGLVDIAKSFKAGYHVLNSEPSTTYEGNGKVIRSLTQQLDGLYSHLGKLISQNIENKVLSYNFKPEFEELQKRAEELLNGISPKKEEFKQVVPQERSSNNDQSSKISELVPSEEAIIRIKNVVKLSQDSSFQSRLALLKHIKDPDSLVRRVIVNCIDPEASQEEGFAIVKLINDPDEDVARIAIRKSAKIHNRLAFSYLISRLESNNVKIRKEAIDALVLITGSDLGFNPSASEGVRTEAVLRWQQLWQDNQMNAQFLIDEEATRSIVKKKYIAKTVAQELQQEKKVDLKAKNTKTPKDPTPSSG